MIKIENITARKILDSRGDSTIEVSLKTSNGRLFSTGVPQGKSKGMHEAISVEPSIAVENVNKILGPALVGLDPSNQHAIDQMLLNMDGTKDKSKMGANAILGISFVCARAAAEEDGLPLWKYLRSISGLQVPAGKNPRLYMNVINGGLHSSCGPNFQEYHIIPETNSFSTAIEDGLEVFKRLGDILLQKFGKGAKFVGDEGGYSPQLNDNLEPFEILDVVIKGLPLKEKVDLGVDVAASNITITIDELNKMYTTLVEKFGLIYIEDPFGENDFDDFSKLTAKYGDKTTIVGDDLTATNPIIMKQVKEKNCINGIIIKPNQIGTLTETFEAVKLAREWGWKVVVSHRSGETNDDFIADLAVGLGADGFKLGAPMRGERIAKYNRLLQIDTENR
ncbi:MAG: enolase C-terminal domain-like protein [Candidatus Paceibacterota bacterium]